MGVIKVTAKIAGTVALTATGVASHILNAAVGMTGENPSSIFADIEDGSFNTIRKMWNPERAEQDAESGINEVKKLERRIQSEQLAREQLNKLMDTAKKAGNMEKYEEFREKRENVIDVIRGLEEELQQMKRDVYE